MNHKFVTVGPADDRRVGRRGFLKSTVVVGAAAATLPAWLAACGQGGSQATAPGVFKATHGTGLCNMGMFLVKERDLAHSENVGLEFVVTPTNADVVTLFGSGQVDVTMVPYTQFMTLRDAGAKVKVVSGGGSEGLTLVARNGITDAQGLRNKTIGTFQADTLEMVPYDYLAKAGMSFEDVSMKYFGSAAEISQAFIGGSVDAISLMEPYASQAFQRTEGAAILSDGVDLYGHGYPDCVLAVREELLTTAPDEIKALIKGLMVAQQISETEREQTVRSLVGKYFKTSMEDTLAASLKQPNIVDIRSKQSFMLERAKGMKELGYLKSIPGPEMFDWSPLSQVIADNPGIYNSLARKSA